MRRQLSSLCLAATTTLFVENTQAQETFPYTDANILFDRVSDYKNSAISKDVSFNDPVPIAGDKLFKSAAVYPTGKISFLGTNEPEENHIDFHGLDWSKDTDKLLTEPSSMFVRFDKFDSQSSDNSAYEDQIDFEIYEAYLWTFEYNFDDGQTLYQIVLAHDEEGLNVTFLRNFISNNLSTDINVITGWSVHIAGNQVCSDTADGKTEGESGKIHQTDISEGLECVDNNAQAEICSVSDLTISGATGTVRTLFQTTFSEDAELGSLSELGRVVAIQKCDGFDEILSPISENNIIDSSDTEKAPESEQITCEYDPDYYEILWTDWEYKCAEINDCLIDQNNKNPCQKGGDAGSSCTDLVRDSPGEKAYDCTCSIGNIFNGDTCQYSNPCTVNPCLNDGRCNWEGGLSFTCSCTPTFEGIFCEREFSICKRSKPCVNGACHDDIEQGYKCECEDGWKGRACDVKIQTISVNNLVLSAKEPCQGGSSLTEPTPNDEDIFKKSYFPFLKKFYEEERGATDVKYIRTYCSENQRAGRHGRFVIQIGFVV